MDSRQVCDSRAHSNDTKKAVIQSLISGSMGSAITTVVFQPLEFIKTQLQTRRVLSLHKVGRSTRSLSQIIQQYDLRYLWRGTGPSLLRSVPGVGLYYGTLNVLQVNFSNHDNRPDSFKQAFCFGVAARSIVSFILLPVTVIKVRWETGMHSYPSLPKAIIDGYTRSGWVAVTPTVLRDSLFSGLYYMCYIRIKTLHSDTESEPLKAYQNFMIGIGSGIVASVATNPLDVIKTRMQASLVKKTTIVQTLADINRTGLMTFFDGLSPRVLRRSLIAASTWTFYELMIDILR